MIKKCEYWDMGLKECLKVLRRVGVWGIGMIIFMGLSFWGMRGVYGVMDIEIDLSEEEKRELEDLEFEEEEEEAQEWEELAEEVESKERLRREYLRAKFLNLGGGLIYRFKPAYRLTREELSGYKEYLLKDINLEDMGDRVRGWIRWGLESRVGEGVEGVDEGGGRVRDGFELMRKITYEHLSKLVEYMQRGGRSEGIGNILKVPPLLGDIKGGILGGEGRRKRFGERLTFEFLEGSEGRRDRMIKSILGGLLNTDPRVRLLSISILRRLIPDIWTGLLINRVLKKENDMGLESSRETVKKNAYEYLDFLRMKKNNVVFKELIKLRRFIARFILINKIRQGEEETIKKMSPYIFRLISRPIDGESYSRIPINYFRAGTEIRSLIKGIRNKNKLIQKECIRSLLRILRIQETEYHLKLEIVEAIIKSPYRSIVLSKFNRRSNEKMNKKEVGEILKEYIKRKTLIRRIDQDADDFYDSKKNLESIKIFKNEIQIKSKKIDRRKYKTMNQEEEAKANMIEREYIFE